MLVVATGFAIGKRQIDRRGASLSVGKQVVTNASKAALGNLKKCGALSTENGIGINNAGTLSGAVLFTSDELTANVGQFINKMQIGFANPSVITSGKIKILTGTPSAFVTKYEQNINVFEEGINEYELDFPYQIPANTNVALAYEIVVTGDLPMGVDEGPAVENGDLVSINGGAWQSLSASDMDYNLIISASTTTEVDNYIILAPNTTYFYTSVGEEAEAKEVELNGYLTEGNITVSLENESAFEICLTEDGTYASSVQVAAANLPATIFVKYNTQATNSLDDETLTATVGELTSTVTLEGRTFDCSTVQTLPYSEDFNEVISPCWTIVDVNEDGYTWEYDASRGGMIVYSYDYDEENDVEIAIDADEYLISTAFEIPEGGAYFTFDTKSAIADYPEAYNVFVATDPENEEAYTEVLPATTTTADWFTNLINIPSSFNGQDVHIIFHMAGRDHYAMILDNFEIMANPTEINVEITDVYTSVDGTVPAGVDFSLGAKIKNLGVAINSFKASYTLNEEAPVVKTFSELEIAFNENYAFNFDAFSLTEGEAEIVVTISEVNGDAEFAPISETITITATTCATIAELPYSENFDNGIPTCWFASDNNLDANSWTDLASTLNAVAGNPEDIAEAMGDVEYYTNDSSANCLVTWSQYPESVEIVDLLPPYGIYFPEFVNAEYENDEYLYTPVITIPQDGAFVKFFQSYFPENASADSIKFYACNTGSLDIEDYTLLYSGKPTNTMTAIETTIPTNMWNSDVRFAFHVFGEEGNVLIDDFTVEALPTDIIAEVEITSPANEANVFVGEELIITADVINGGTMISELTLAFEIDGVEIDRDTVREASIYYGEAQNYIFDPYTEITAGEHTIVVTLSNVNEDDTFEAVTDTIIVNAIECTPVTEFPYIEDFENDLDPCWQVINANNDNKTWSVSDGVLTYGYNTSNAADDYVITKAINFTEAGTYFVRFDYRARSATFPENLAFLSGANADVETMTTIEAFENLTTATYTTYTYNLVITEPTTKYFAFKAYSIADRFGIYIDNFNIIAAPTTAEIALTSVAPATATTIRYCP